MSNQPIWITPAGTLGTLPADTFYSVQLEADEPITLATVYFRVVSGGLPPGMVCSEAGLISGTPIRRDGYPYTSRFTIRAYTRIVVNGKPVEDRILDRSFNFVVEGDQPPQWLTTPGLIDTYYTGEYLHPTAYAQLWDNPSKPLWGLQLYYTQFDQCTVNFVNGSLPPDATIDDKGFISGFLIPDKDKPAYTEYTFTLEITNGRYSNLRTFALGVYNLASLTADTTKITADNVIPINTGATVAPYMTTYAGPIGIVEPGDYFCFQFQGFDVQGVPFQFSSLMTADFGYDMTDYDEDGTLYDGGAVGFPPDLVLDPNSGWLYGRISPSAKPRTYRFGIAAHRTDDPAIVGPTNIYTIQVVRDLSPTIHWLSTSGATVSGDVIDLGYIENGDPSWLQVKAYSDEGQELFYRLAPGVATRMPQGLTLLPNGLIIGRVSFETFCLDSDYTTFDNTAAFFGTNLLNTDTQTTFDLDNEFTVEVYSADGAVAVTQKFIIHVRRSHQRPFETVYIKAMPPVESRCMLATLLENDTIFPESRVYRKADPYFGVAKSVVYEHAYGMEPAHLDAYIVAQRLNHYRKRVVLSNMKVAYAVDDAGVTLYEVIYVDVVDDQVNNVGASISKRALLPYWVDENGYSLNSTNLNPDNPILYVYPNSLENMQEQIIDTVGRVERVLPLWMRCNQPDGTKLGMTRAWVITYAKPGTSARITYDIRNFIGNDFNLVDFDIDRYEIGKQATKYWDIDTASWPEVTTTTFDLYDWDTTYRFLRRVDYGTQRPYCELQGVLLSTINATGGFDGVMDEDVAGRMIIFYKQEGYAGLTDTQAWTDNSTGAVVPSAQRMWIYQIWIEHGVVWLVPLYSTVDNDYVIVRTGNTFNENPIYYPATPGPGQTVVCWTTLPIPSGDQTTFDENTLNFVDPLDAYESKTDEYDQYAAFPKVNVLY